MIQFCVLLAAIASCLFRVEGSTSFPCCGSKRFESFPAVPVDFSNDTLLRVNEAWQPFFYGPTGTWALPSNSSGAFYTFYKVPIVIRISDAFKTGDRFALYLNNTFVGNTTIGALNSTNYTPFPNEAWLQANFSHGEWLIPPGLHRFTIKTINSVGTTEASGGGTAFIRADVNPSVECGNCRPFCTPEGPCKCFPSVDPENPPGCCANNPRDSLPICEESSGKFTLIKGQFTRDQGIIACQARNLRLAEINSINFDGVNQFAFVCNGGQVAQSWIRSWNGDAYQDACLILSSGSFGGTGAITAQDCKSTNHVLCQA